MQGLTPALTGVGLPLPSEFWEIETQLERFRSHLPTVDIGHPTDQISLVTHAFVNVAILCLHSPYINVYAEARSKCFTAASCVAARLADAHLTEWEMVDPILGVRGSPCTTTRLLTGPSPSSHSSPLSQTCSSLTSPTSHKRARACRRSYQRCNHSLG
jgi:hypothetical protein